ncbi:MAG TPA: alpha-glucosidase [Candidatus Limnocylindrales bacterium]|nr:alpha-glucosidase [Candidatus Limnocylindrales bacterium]
MESRLAQPDPGRPLHPDATDWWRRGVVYQIYPRSFADANGDGIGDLAGIIDHLDHLGPAGLGVDAIWLSPIYPSPGLDVGYDVSDHQSVDPRFGTEAEFDRLIWEAHRRGLRIVLDLVMNHTSDQHPWFQASRTSRDDLFADWYLWRDPAGFDRRGRPRRPNNWVSFFGGPAWTWEPERGQFYLHTFLPQQPDLNWRNPAVEEAQFRMVRGWLDRGVDGFRLDVFNVFLKHPDLPSNPRRRGTTAWGRQHHRYDRDQPDFVDLVGRFRDLVDSYPDRFTVGELFDAGPERAAELTADRHLVFDWEVIEAPWSAEAISSIIDRREQIYGEARWPALVLSNHDQPRHASRLARSAGIDDIDGIAKAAALALLTFRGTPFLYYGEEIGMVDVPIPADEIVDPPARRASAEFPWWNRDQCRTPMPWSGGPGAGFTTGQPWIRIGDDAASRNVEAQAADPDSVLACYRRLLATRRATPALHGGSFLRVAVDAPDVLAWQRRSPKDAVLVLVNFAAEARSVRWSDPPGQASGLVPIVGTHRDPAHPTAPNEITLRPLEGVVLGGG